MCCAFANPQSSFFFFENIWLLRLPTKILKRLLFSLSFFRCSWYATAAAAILCRNPSTLRSFSFVFYIEKKKSYSFLEKYRGELRWQRRQLNAFLLFCSLYWKEWNLICFSLYYFFFFTAGGPLLRNIHRWRAMQWYVLSIFIFTIRFCLWIHVYRYYVLFFLVTLKHCLAEQFIS